MFLIVGLGNPGIEYHNTRHNVGFMALELISEKFSFSWSHKLKFRSDIANGESEFGKLILCKPDTFMNRSGVSLGLITNFYKIPLSNVIVIHDDIDLPLCKIKHKIGGGAGGHNGLRSIDSLLGKDYHRIRIGVGRPENTNYNISDYVLGKFSDNELKMLDKHFVEVINSLNSIMPFV